MASSTRFKMTTPGAFTADDAIGCGIERIASALRRKRTGAGEEHVPFRQQVYADTSRDRQRRFAGAKAAAGELDGQQGTGASRIQRETRAMEIEKVREAVRDDAVGGSAPVDALNRR